MKLCGKECNYLKINDNLELSAELTEFLSKPENMYLWKLDTSRQTVVHSLRHTEAIHLRIPKNPELTPIEMCNIHEIIDSELLEIPIFKKTMDWIIQSLKQSGADTVELGRVFFSNHHASSIIDEHTDVGRYFRYYDRFHFTIDQINDKNIFYIRDEPLMLQLGNLYWINNHVSHRLQNLSDQDRINLIVDARLL